MIEHDQSTNNFSTLNVLEQPFSLFKDILYRVVISQHNNNIANTSFDIIFATNIIHLSKNLEATFHEIKQILNPGGALILNESIPGKDFSTVITGLTDGWRSYQALGWRTKISPLINCDQ